MSAEKAVAHYLNKGGKGKLNCAQAVAAAFGDKLGSGEDSVGRFAGYGHGKAPGGVCGAYHAAEVILQAKDGPAVSRLRGAFIDKAGSLKCEEIRRLRMLPCAGCVETAAAFLGGVEGGRASAACSAKTAPRPSPGVGKISPEAVRELMARDPGVRVVDVRSGLEFSEVHIDGSVNIPLDMLNAKLDELKGSGSACVVLCRTGNRSAIAADMLARSGAASVKLMDGGISRWQKEGAPVVKGKGGMPLERQIRVIAGSLVVLGAALSLLVNPGFVLLSLFVGCGLVYAGLTDNCLMGILLMKLPYNKRLYGGASCGNACSGV